MRKFNILFLFTTILSLVMNGCASTSSPHPNTTPLLPTPTRLASGKIIVVASPEDNGPATMRQALWDSETGDVITFDPEVFPPDSPAIIYLTSELPPIEQGHLILDASEAGVILDGSNIPSSDICGLQIYSNRNTIQGLQIVNFSGAGIVLSGQAQYNLIGGDRNAGAMSPGRGNLISSNGIGIGSDMLRRKSGMRWEGIFGYCHFLLVKNFCRRLVCKRC